MPTAGLPSITVGASNDPLMFVLAHYTVVRTYS
jgi:hypothetical protein